MKKFFYITIISFCLWLLVSCEFNIENGTNEHRLATPKIELVDNILSWDVIDNASHCEIYINGQLVDTVKEIGYILTDRHIGAYKVKIRAINKNALVDSSFFSNEVIYDPGFSQKPKDFSINVLQTNDNHGMFYSEDGFIGMTEFVSIFNDNNIRIANGDILQGSYESYATYGQVMIDALNILSFDCFVIGNHEFDWGIEKVARFADGDVTNGEANFPFLAANIIDKRTNQMLDWTEPYTIVEYQGYKVGIIGVIGETLESSISADKVANYEFLDTLPIVKKYSLKLRQEENCDLVLVSTHNYYEPANEEYSELTGDMRIDGIICGHTHQHISEYLTRYDNYKIPVVQSTAYNGSVGIMKFNFIDEQLVNAVISHLYPNKDYHSSEYTNKIRALVADYKTKISGGDNYIGSTSAGLNRSELGKITVNAIKKQFNSDVAVINTGCIRTDLGAGAIYQKNMYKVIPFDDYVLNAVVTGANIKAMYRENSSYLYFNDGFNPNDFNDNEEYIVSVIDYVAYGVYSAKYFSAGAVNVSDTLVRDVLIAGFDELYNIGK